MNKKIWLFIAIMIISIVVLGVVITSGNTETDNTIIKDTNEIKEKKVYKHTFPERISKNDYFKGEFISNDIASIYPRRDALVRDILVDIGDEVKAGETLAILFNPGVEGEGQSKINLKDTIVSTKNDLLSEIKKVKDAKINELNQKIDEKLVILEETIRNYDVKMSQIGNIDDMGSEYQVEQTSLENLKNNLINSLATRDNILIESNNNISQKEELLALKIGENFHKIIPILYVGNEDEIDYEKINSSNFANEFGARNTQIKNDLIDKIKKYTDNKDSDSVLEKYNNLLEINNNLILTLHNTVISVSITEEILSDHINAINSFNNILTSQKEILDDAIYGHEIIKQTQKEKIENLELLISKKEKELGLLGSKLLTIESDKQLNVSKIKAEIDTLKKSRDLLIASENKSITTIENEIAIAKADLNSEYIKSGDYKIVSPFSGVISKRGIEIGEKISPSIEAFRISGVDTTLSRITKKEVKFYVPENLKDSLLMGDVIRFSLGEKNNTFTGSIYRISPEIDSDTLSIIVQAKVSDDIMLPNKSTLRVQLETKQDIFKIPSSTIYNKEERKIIYYKKDNGKLGVRDIEIISDDGEYSLVAGNIDEELKIVTTPIFIK